MIYLQLFWSFFQIGLFAVGGGYAALPLIQSQVVAQNAWLTLSEFTDIVTISQITPGPIAINAATFVGIRIAGVGGALIATLGCVTPSFVISLVLGKLYFRYRQLSIIQGALGGLRPAVTGLIASAGLSIIVLAFWGEGASLGDALSADWLSVGLFAAALAALRAAKWNPILVILGCGAVSLLLYGLGIPL